MVRAALALLAAATWACGGGGHGTADGGRGDAGDAGAGTCAAPADLDSLDLLFVVDDRNVLNEPTDSFTTSPSVVPLTLLDAWPFGDEPPARTFQDAHIGVITSYVGTAGYEGWGNCERALDEGDDGLLIQTPAPDSFVPNVDCLANPERFVSWEAGEDLQDRHEEVDCIASRPFEGCGLRRPFEALRRALVDHRDGENAGFLRDDSLLAILVLTRGDDCSAAHDSFYDSEAPLESPRCARYMDQLQDVRETAATLRDLRPCPGHVFIGLLGGVPMSGCPLGLVDESGLDCVLDHEDMQIRFDPDRGTQVPVCEGFFVRPPPARRLVELQRALVPDGAGAAIASECPEHFQRDLVRLAHAVAEFGARR